MLLYVSILHRSMATTPMTRITPHNVNRINTRYHLEIESALSNADLHSRLDSECEALIMSWQDAREMDLESMFAPPERVDRCQAAVDTNLPLRRCNNRAVELVGSFWLCASCIAKLESNTGPLTRCNEQYWKVLETAKQFNLRDKIARGVEALGCTCWSRQTSTDHRPGIRECPLSIAAAIREGRL